MILSKTPRWALECVATSSIDVWLGRVCAQAAPVDAAYAGIVAADANGAAWEALARSLAAALDEVTASCSMGRA